MLFAETCAKTFFDRIRRQNRYGFAGNLKRGIQHEMEGLLRVILKLAVVQFFVRAMRSFFVVVFSCTTMRRILKKSVFGITIRSLLKLVSGLVPSAVFNFLPGKNAWSDLPR